MRIEEELSGKIRNIVQPLLAELHLVLVDIAVQRRNRDLAIEVFVDRPQGGINLDECAQLNVRLSGMIEGTGLIPGGFFLEVSSPGLDRPLKTSEDFVRAVNRQVRFLLMEPLSGKLEYTGLVQSVETECVTIINATGVVTIPVRIINKAIQIIE